MPFKSKKQEAWMKFNEPEIYARWVKKYGHYKSKKKRTYAKKKKK